MRGLLINVIAIAFLVTLYIYINTDRDKSVVGENTAQTKEIEPDPLITQEIKSNFQPKPIRYEIKPGDTLSGIAARNNTTTDEIKAANNLSGDNITAGQFLEIPSSGDSSEIVVAQTKAVSAHDVSSGLLLAQNDLDAPQEGFDDDLGAGASQWGDDQPTDSESEVEDAPDADPRNLTHEQRRQLRLQRRMGSKSRYEEQLRKAPSNQKNKPEDEESPPETKREEVPREQYTPPTPPPPREITGPETRTTEEEVVNIQPEMDVQDLIQTISEITGENFVLDESVKGKKVTVIAPGGFKKENAMRLFETILDLNGFSIVEKNGTNLIVPKREIKNQSIPTEVGTKMGDSSDRYITRLVPLQNIRANDAANLLKPLISREGDIVVYPAMNLLIIIETVDNLNRVLEIIENLDVETEIEFIKLQNAEAGDVATKLIEIFGGSAGGTTPVRRAQPATRAGRDAGTRTRATQRRAAQPQAAAQVTSQGQTPSSLGGFKVITDDRTNSLIVIAYPDDMAKIKAVIEILDVETEVPEDGIYVIRLLNADAEQVVGVLSSLFGGGGGVRSSLASRQPQQRGVANTLTAGRGSAFGTTEITGVGSGAAARQAITRQATSGLSAAVAETEGLRITADPSTNSVIIIGSRRDYETVKAVIEQLDIRRKQVFVEAAILEVSLDKLRSFGTNLSIGFTINDNNLAFGGTILPGVPSLLGVAADPENSVNLVGSLSGLFLGVIGEEVDPDGSGPIPPIPSFSALFQALTSLTDVNVLSTPSIITTDNEPAEIVVADVIPFPTGNTVGEGGVTVQTIQREPVGIRLSITPQISEGDFLNLNILTEVSAIRDAPAGLNTAQFGIATTTRTADSSVVVKDGQTIVIGGLVQDREGVLQNRVPVLGRIPVLGNLFKFKQRQSQKINLMILLTPRIVETEADMQELLEDRQRRNMLLQERGFNREDN